jgi:hypothetical protein
MILSPVVAAPKRKRKIPDYLIYEIMDGQPIYYKGYQSVLNKTKNLEDIIGCSSLQAVLVDYMLCVIYGFIDRSKYRVLSSEIGSHIDTGNNFSNDIAIYEKSVLPAEKINKNILTCRPKSPLRLIQRPMYQS